MSAKTIAFFNNKGGVGKTSLVYHIAAMYAELDIKIIAADLDPQANLTAVFVDEDSLESLWTNQDAPCTIFKCVDPLKAGRGDVKDPDLKLFFSDQLALVSGDLSLSQFEDDLSSEWPKCMDGQERAFRVISAFWRILQRAAEIHNANLILVDIGPNLGAINRATLISSDYVVVPLSPDIFSIQGMRNLGPTLRRWRSEWNKRLEMNPVRDLPMPSGRIDPVGYIVMQHSERLDRPVQAYKKWIERIPQVYSQEVLGNDITIDQSVYNDPNCLALLKHYRSLMPMAQESRKPMFHLKPADGAIGSHVQAVQGVHRDFKALSIKIAEKIGIVMP